MKRINLSLICDSLLSGFIVFFIINVTLRSVIPSKLALFILSLVVGLCCSAFVFIIILKSNDKSLLRRAEQKRIDYILSELELMPDNRLIALFIPIFDRTQKAYIKHDDCIETEECFYFFDFNQQTNRQSAVDKIRRSNGKKVVLFCCQPTADCLAFCKKHSDRLTCADKNVLFDIEKEYNLELPIAKEDKKPSFKTRILSNVCAIASLRQALTFALSGAGIILFSKISFFPKWYIFCGMTLLIFAAVLAVIRIVAHTTPKKKQATTLF